MFPVFGKQKPFVRHFGRARRRNRGADFAFLDEQAFCNASKAIKFPSLQKADYGYHHPNLAFRRLFYDGRCVGRVEVGYAYDSPGEGTRYLHWDDGYRDSPYYEILPTDLFLKAATIDTQVYDARAKKYRSSEKLIYQGQPLADLFQISTSANANEANDERCVVSGNPLILMECTSDAFDKLPRNFNKVDPDETKGVRLAYGRSQGSLTDDIGIWFVDYGDASFEAVRSVRLCLARLHAEQEALASVLSGIQSGKIRHEPNTDQGNALENYLNEATKKLSKASAFGVSKSSIATAMHAAEVTAVGQKIEYLRDALETARTQVKRKVEIAALELTKRQVTKIFTSEVNMNTKTINIGAGAQVNAPVVVAETIENSFQTIDRSNVGTDLKDAVSALLSEIARASEHMNSDQANELARDAETLTKELASEKPRESWYNLALENIKKIAKDVGDVGVPILKSAAALAPLIAKLFG
nr:hypothetical protein [uncultured Ruegeria sp.]